MAGENDLLLKVAADVQQAVQAFSSVASSINAMANAVSDASKVTEASNSAAKGFWETWIGGVDKGGAASVAWGQQMSSVIDGLRDGVVNAARALPNLIANVAAAGDEMITLSNQLDVPVEKLAELRFIGEQSGASLQVLGRLSQEFSKELLDSTSKAAVGVEGLGLSLDALKSQDPTDALLATVEAIQRTVPESERAAKMMELFGFRARSVTMLLKEDIGELRQTFADLGGGMTTDLASAGDEYGDNLNKIRLVQEQFRNDIAAKFLPTINQVLEQMPMLGGAVLTFGESMLSAAGNLLPMVTNLALLNGKLPDLLSGFTRFVPSFAGVSGAIASFATRLTSLLPIMASLGTVASGGIAALAASAAPIAAVAVALGVLGAAVYQAIGGWEGLSAILDEVASVVQGVWQFLQDLAVIVTGLARTLVTDFVGAVRSVVDWLGKIPGMSSGVSLLGTAFDAVIKSVQKALEWIGRLYGSLKSLFSWVASNVHEYADSFREATAATEEATAATEQHAEAQQKAVSGYEILARRNEKLRAELAGLTAEQKAAIKSALDLGTSLSEIAELTHVSQGALELFKKQLEAAKKASEDSPLGKFMKELNEVGPAIDRAVAAGAKMPRLVEEFGKKASDLATQAARIPGAFQRLPAAIRDVSEAFRQAEWTTVWDKVNLATRKVADTIKAELNTALRETAKLMSDDIVASFMLVAEINQEMTDAFLTEAERRERTLRREEEAMIAVARTRKGVSERQMREEIDAIQAKYAQLRALDLRYTGDVEKDAELRGIKTKSALEQELATERKVLAEMLASRGDFTREAIEKQKDIVEAAEVAAGKVKVDWLGALGVMSQAWSQLAQAAQGSLGRVASFIGQSINQVNVFATSIKSSMEAFSKGGFQGIMGGISGLVSAAGVAIEVGKKMWDAFTKSPGEKVAKDIGRDFGVKISEAMGDELAKQAKELFGGDRFAASVFNLSKIIEQAGGVTEKNFTQMIGRLRDVFVMVERGTFTTKQATEVLEANFDTFANAWMKTGDLVSGELLEIMDLAKRAGIESQAIAGFVTGQLERIGAGMVNVLKPFAKEAEGLPDRIKRAQDELARTDVGSSAYEKQKQKVAELRVEQERLAAESMPAITRAGNLMAAAFNAATERGASMTEAVDALGPGLDTLIATMNNLGIEVQNSSVQWIVAFRDKVNTNRELVDSATSLNDVMVAMASIGALNEESFADLQAQGLATYDSLIAKGFTERESLTMMVKFLENARQAHEELGLPIDENTQRLIDQAEAQGVLSEKQMSTNDIMMEGLGAIIEALGGKLPEAWSKAKSAAEKSTAEATTGVKKVGDALNGVNGAITTVGRSLYNTGWDRWASEAVDAAAEAQAAVDSVSFGNSPGGLKEIPRFLRQSTTMFKEFAATGVRSSKSVLDVVNDLAASSEFGVGLTPAVAAGPSIDSASLDRAFGPSTINLNFSVNTVNSDGVKQAVEQQFLPAIIDAVDKNNRGALTKLRQLLKG